MKILRRAWMLALLCSTPSMESLGLESGKLIPVGTAEGQGPLAAPAVVTRAVGHAFVFDSDRPDLFVATTKFGLHTGLFLYRWQKTSASGAPVFGSRVEVPHPFGTGPHKYPPAGHIFELEDGSIHGLWNQSGSIVFTRFDKNKLTFAESSRARVEGLPRAGRSICYVPSGSGKGVLLIEVGDGVASHPTDYRSRDPRYNPFDGRGIWRGGMPRTGLYACTMDDLDQPALSTARMVTESLDDVRFGYSRVAVVNLGKGRERDIVGGSRHGNLHYYPNEIAANGKLGARRLVTGPDGIAHRHPTINPGPLAYPSARKGLSDLIAGGEGSLYHYTFSGRFSDGGAPVFLEPVPVIESNALLYAGTLPVPNVVDWDGDGIKDIVSGNSEGLVLFFKNTGANDSPAFDNGKPIKAGGDTIHIQPGYRLDIQGPPESRWGYTAPTVLDWNGDGLLDIVMSDSTARHTVYINKGEPASPTLAHGRPLYYDGLDMYGTWRVKPGAGKVGARMAYVALDDDDEFHLYWQVDAYNVTEGGKLKLEDGRVIGANFLSSGGSGRLKINLVDWDLDGKKDLLVGTPRHGSVPDPDHGLPQSLGLPGSAVLFMKNVGVDEMPVFRYPVLMHHDEEPIFLGQHACGPAVADFGDEHGPHLIIGEESGRFYFYDRRRLSAGSGK